MRRHLTTASPPALGDIRAMREGDVIDISRAMRQHKQWSRYVEAIAAALSKGAEIRWTTPGRC